MRWSSALAAPSTIAPPRTLPARQADEVAGSKCLELAEAVLAAAHDLEGAAEGAAAAPEGEAGGGTAGAEEVQEAAQ